MQKAKENNGVKQAKGQIGKGTQHKNGKQPTWENERQKYGHIKN